MKEIPLTQGQVAIVDDDDFERLSQFKWDAQKTQTIRGFVAKRTVYLGKEDGKEKFIAIQMHTEILPKTPGFVTDHINRDSLDNRKSNLRYATHQQNSCNRAIRRDNTSGYKGVYVQPNGRFRAFIRSDGRGCHLGYFSGAEEAARAYNQAAVEHFGDFATLNSIESRG